MCSASTWTMTHQPTQRPHPHVVRLGPWRPRRPRHARHKRLPPLCRRPPCCTNFAKTTASAWLRWHVKSAFPRRRSAIGKRKKGPLTVNAKCPRATATPVSGNGLNQSNDYRRAPPCAPAHTLLQVETHAAGQLNTCRVKITTLALFLLDTRLTSEPTTRLRLMLTSLKSAMIDP